MSLFNIGMVPQSKQQEDLFAVAKHCAQRHMLTGCYGCNTCDFNIDLMGYNPVEIRLVKANAKAAVESKSYMRMLSRNTEPVLVVLGILVILLALLPMLIDIFKPPQDVYKPPRVTETIEMVAELIRDVNNDGDLNCIDYAVVFYELYPNSKIIHVWDYRMLNHLVNRVGETYIEPQIASGDPMEVWRTSFGGAIKRDETEKYRVYATQRRW